MAIETFDQGRIVLARRTTAVIVVVYAYIASWAFFIAASLGDMAGILPLGPEGVSQVTALVGLLAVLTIISSVVIVGMWIYRAHANLRLAGGQYLEFTPGWAVGWYFIPVASLFKPYQAMRELWNASSGHTDSFAADGPYPLRIWWGLWISGSILSNVSSRVTAIAGPNGSSAVQIVDLISWALLIGAAWFLLRIVNAINNAQQSTLGVAETFA
jgi:hypothetical protein